MVAAFNWHTFCLISPQFALDEKETNSVEVLPVVSNNCKSIRLILSFLVLLSAPMSQGLAQSHPESDPDQKEKKEKKQATNSISIVQVGETVRLVPDKEMAALRKEIANQHKEEIKEWTEEKKAAKKAKERFDAPKPKAPPIKVLKAGIRNEETAEALRVKFEANIAQKKEKTIRYVVASSNGTLSVMTSTAADEAKKKIEAEYRTTLKEYALAKQTASKDRKPFDLPKPQKPTFRIMSGKFATEQEATAALAKADQAQKKKTKNTDGKGSPKKAPSPPDSPVK